jgi:hypothetical protein
MNEAEWVTCLAPAPMLDHLHGRISERKMRLFVQACCRRVRQLFHEPPLRKAFGVAERFAEGAATAEELADANRAAVAAFAGWGNPDPERHPAAACASAAAAAVAVATELALCRADAVRGAEAAAEALALSRAAADQERRLKDPRAWVALRRAERAAQAQILRDLLGNPYRPVELSADYLQWNDGTVGRLAQAIEESRSFDRLPLLADALEEAGCTAGSVLNHCRHGGPHAVGCWVVDLVLHRE